MRTSVTDELRALRRPAAVAALVAATGGVVCALAPTLDLWVLRADVRALDTTDSATVAVLSGAQATPAVWLVTAAGLVGTAVALLLAVDRPVRGAATIALGAAALVLVVVGFAALSPPEPAAFAGDARADELLGRELPLPMGVDIGVAVAGGRGLWVLTTSALAVAVGTAAAARG